MTAIDMQIDKDTVATASRQARVDDTQYIFRGSRFLTDPEAYSAGPMPWGTLNAVDMKAGQYLWKVPFGQHAELPEKGLSETGSENHGGSALTATGVLFTGSAERDLKFRAYDTRNDKILWEAQLPGHGAATPAIYAVNGKQYVVIAPSPPRNSSSATSAPASRNSAVSSATHVAFALP